MTPKTNPPSANPNLLPTMNPILNPTFLYQVMISMFITLELSLIKLIYMGSKTSPFHIHPVNFAVSVYASTVYATGLILAVMLGGGTAFGRICSFISFSFGTASMIALWHILARVLAWFVVPFWFFGVSLMGVKLYFTFKNPVAAEAVKGEADFIF